MDASLKTTSVNKDKFSPVVLRPLKKTLVSKHFALLQPFQNILEFLSFCFLFSQLVLVLLHSFRAQSSERLRCQLLNFFALSFLWVRYYLGDKSLKQSKNVPDNPSTTAMIESLLHNLTQWTKLVVNVSEWWLHKASSPYKDESLDEKNIFTPVMSCDYTNSNDSFVIVPLNLLHEYLPIMFDYVYFDQFFLSFDVS